MKETNNFDLRTLCPWKFWDVTCGGACAEDAKRTPSSSMSPPPSTAAAAPTPSPSSAHARSRGGGEWRSRSPTRKHWRESTCCCQSLASGGKHGAAATQHDLVLNSGCETKNELICRGDGFPCPGVSYTTPLVFVESMAAAGCRLCSSCFCCFGGLIGEVSRVSHRVLGC